MANKNKERTPAVIFRWERGDEFDDELPDSVSRSEGLRSVLNEWLDSDRDLPAKDE